MSYTATCPKSCKLSKDKTNEVYTPTAVLESFSTQTPTHGREVTKNDPLSFNRAQKWPSTFSAASDLFIFYTGITMLKKRDEMCNAFHIVCIEFDPLFY